MQDADDIDPRDLKRRAQEIKDRLLKSDSAEGLVGELALLHELLAGLQGAIESLGAQQRVFEAALAARDVLMSPEAMGAHKLPTQVSIEADHLINPEDGFYALEHNERGRPFRWTGPAPEFGFTVFIDRAQPLLMTASFLNALDPAVFAFVRCFCDGRQLEVGHAVEGGLHRLYVQLPARPGPDSSRTALAFVLPQMQSPRERDPASGDERLLGLAFAALSLAPGEVPSGITLLRADARAVAGGERRGEAAPRGAAVLRPRAVAAAGGGKDG